MPDRRPRDGARLAPVPRPWRWVCRLGQRPVGGERQGPGQRLDLELGNGATKHRARRSPRSRRRTFPRGVWRERLVGQRHRDLMALAAIAHEGLADLDQRLAGRRRPHDGLGLGAHDGEQARSASWRRTCRAADGACARPRRRSEARRKPKAEPTPAPTGTTIFFMPSLRASRAACSGAAPPKAISARSAVSLPFSTACTRAALAMVSSTISATPAGGALGVGA